MNGRDETAGAEANEAAHRRPSHEVAEILKRYGGKYLETRKVPLSHLNVINRLVNCRTAWMGGHADGCDACGHVEISYNSCGDRHCPKCRSIAGERWLNARREELLPVGYFHLVFTLPHDLNPLVLCNMKRMLDMLFSAVNETILAFGEDPRWRLNGRTGMIAVLHTWTQTLMDHFHLHCLIPGGALSFDGRKWNPARRKFLFRKDSLAKAFKKRYIEKLEAARKNGELIFPGETEKIGTAAGFESLVRTLWKKKWVVYAKRPFAGPEHVLSYLGAYTHRVAISNHRIKAVGDGEVTFVYKDRKNNNRTERMTLDASEFIRRFLLHVLPKGFMKIRYFGFLFHREKRKNIERIRALIGSSPARERQVGESVRDIMLRITGKDIALCPKCGKSRMKRIGEFGKGIFGGFPTLCNSP